MTLFEVEAVYGYWREHPPPHLLLAAFLGVTSHRHSPPRPFEADADASIPAIPGLKPGAIEDGLRAATLDFEDLKRHHQG